MKKLLSVVLMVCLVAFLAAGCTSSTGAALSNALAKAVNYKSFDSSTEVKFNIKYNNFPDYDNSMMLVNDMFSNISAKMVQTVDLNKLQSKAQATVKLNGITADFEAYTTEESAWVKLPVFSKYLKFDQAKLNGFQSKEKFLVYERQMPVLLGDFAKKYFQNYKFKLENIKDNGSVSIQTPDGTKNAKEIEVTLNDAQFKEFIKYGAKELLGSEDFKKLIIDVAKLLDEDGTAVDEELEKDLEEALNTAKEEVDSNFDEAMKNLEMLDKGLVIKFYIDSNGDIIRDDINLAFRIKQDNSYYYNSENQEEQSVDITLSIKDDYWNINKAVSINYPTFNDDNTISYEDYEGSRMSVKQLLEEYKEAKRRERISEFYVGSEYAFIKGQYVIMNSPSYNKNNTIYVPAKYIADAVGAKVEGNGKTVKFTNGNDTLVLYVNSKKATLNGQNISNSFVTEVKDGTSMVPLKVVAQSFGAKIEWNQYSRSITVEAQK